MSHELWEHNSTLQSWMPEGLVVRVLGPHAAVPGGGGGGGGAAYGQMPMGGGYPPFPAGQGAMAPPQVTPGSSYGTRSAGTPSGYGSDGGGSGQGYGSRSSRGAGTAPPPPRSSGGPSSPPLVFFQAPL